MATYDPNVFMPHIAGGRFWEYTNHLRTEGRWIDSDGNPLDPDEIKARLDGQLADVIQQRASLLAAVGVVDEPVKNPLEDELAALKAELAALKEALAETTDITAPTTRAEKIQFCESKGATVKGNISTVDLDALVASLSEGN